MVRMTDGQFETICNIIAQEDWTDFEFKFVEDITNCILVGENINNRSQVHILIDMYGEELRRSIVKVGDIEWVT